MDSKERCQSCAMPIGPGLYGNEVDGEPNMMFCKFCFKDGGFCEPGLSVGEMIQRSVEHMVSELKLARDQAETLANQMIPSLGRWKNRSHS